MDNYIITISRQFGSLGRNIAKLLARELDINYYDRDLLEKAAENMGISVPTLSSYDESFGGVFAKMLYPMGVGPISLNKKLYEFQKSLILDLAATESCVIVGRCADYILKDHPNCLNIFIYAPYEQRLINCVNDLNLPDSEARKMILGVDKARSAYHKYFTDTDIDYIDNRQLCIDSSLLSIEDTLDILKAIVKKRFSNN